MSIKDDDIDSLLAELDGNAGPQSLLKPRSPASPPPPRSPRAFRLGAAVVKQTAPPAAAGKDVDADIDDLLAELGAADIHATPPSRSQATPLAQVPGASLPAVPPSSTGPTSALAAQNGRPPPVPGLTYGRTALRCTKCDFRVYVFDDRRWSASVDYMFLRNFMPDATKVIAKLTLEEGAQAYACQCAWCTVEQYADPKLTHWFRAAGLVADPLL
mmetsp:Transcript_14208/g.43062  ORF Transcript_14208/g.43062 Transcript_14208/m.43062 type:complete len:215 (+) Transcript_14208:100-744(+)